MNGNIASSIGKLKSVLIFIKLNFLDATQHGDIGGYGIPRPHSPPPAHQQASPITPVKKIKKKKFTKI